MPRGGWVWRNQLMPNVCHIHVRKCTQFTALAAQSPQLVLASLRCFPGANPLSLLLSHRLFNRICMSFLLCQGIFAKQVGLLHQQLSRTPGSLALLLALCTCALLDLAV